jgi:hypothetical protein
MTPDIQRWIVVPVAAEQCVTRARNCANASSGGAGFNDFIRHPEGRYGCRWHECDRVNHVNRRVAINECRG